MGSYTPGPGSGVMSNPAMMAASPYMVTGEGGLASPGPGVKKDDKYWERRR